MPSRQPFDFKIIRQWAVFFCVVFLIIGALLFFVLGYQQRQAAKQDDAVEILQQVFNSEYVLAIKFMKDSKKVLLDLDKSKVKIVVDSSKSDQKSASLKAEDVPTKENVTQSDISANNASDIHPGEVVKLINAVPGKDIQEAVIRLDKNILARQKVSGGQILEQKGEIPDGTIKVIDASSNAYGEENYEGGQLSGNVKMYYNDGQIKSDALYQHGQLLKIQEYYSDGSLRSTVDYNDAIEGVTDREIGVGKIYYKNGNLKYEWNLTKSEQRGFKRSYSNDGKVTSETFYSQSGKQIKK